MFYNKAWIAYWKYKVMLSIHSKKDQTAGLLKAMFQMLIASTGAHVSHLGSFVFQSVHDYLCQTYSHIDSM